MGKVIKNGFPEGQDAPTINWKKLVRTHRLMMLKLITWKPIPLHELRECLYDELSSDKVAINHLCKVRTRIKEYGLGLYRSEYDGVVYYQLVKITAPPNQNSEEDEGADE